MCGVKSTDDELQDDQPKYWFLSVYSESEAYQIFHVQLTLTIVSPFIAELKITTTDIQFYTAFQIQLM